MSNQSNEERVTVCFCGVCSKVTSTYRADPASIVKPSPRNLMLVSQAAKLPWCTHVSHNNAALKDAHT